MLALDGCGLNFSLGGSVEVAEAGPLNRAFPARVSETLGVCLKVGPEHRVMADGRELVFPADALCVRSPGCVWAAEATGPVGFLSVDVHRSLLPAGVERGPMSFASRRAVPGFAEGARALQRGVAPRVAKEIVASLVLALESAGLFSAEELRERAPSRTALRARDALEDEIESPPSVEALARDLGTNRFALMRAFKRAFGITPHAFVVRVRVERARERLARGRGVLEVAHELGFADQSHFTRAFKRVVGLTPGAYARRARPARVVP